MHCDSRVYACGVTCLYSGDIGKGELSTMLQSHVATGAFGFALVYFSKSAFTGSAIIKLMKAHAAGLNYAACSTAGEITPDGQSDGTMMVVLFPKCHFRMQALAIDAVGSGNLEGIASKVADFRESFVADRTDTSMETTVFAICLMDGMSYMEEAMTAAIHWGLDDIPLLGGSAGDDMNFAATNLILNGKSVGGSALIVFAECSLPVRIFKTENFVPTNEKLVVTRSDPDKRIVYEFNAAPAAETYSKTIGTDPKSLAPQSFASHPLVMRVGGEYYCRSIQKVNDDGSLSFFCAIDDGIVLTVAEPTGMARTTKLALEKVKDDMGEVDFILGFDCVLRQIDARNRQVTRKISEIYRDNRLIGFNTYGEQYRSMHLNQTLTGIAFGKMIGGNAR